MYRYTAVKYMGDKTTFRLVNRKYTTSLLDGDAASQDISPEEEVLFWNYFSAPYLRSLAGLALFTTLFCSQNTFNR